MKSEIHEPLVGSKRLVMVSKDSEEDIEEKIEIIDLKISNCEREIISAVNETMREYWISKEISLSKLYSSNRYSACWTYWA
jgi:hypothetical protein